MQVNRLIKLEIILGLFFSTTVFAETVTLNSGKIIEGKILEKTDQYIKIEYNGSPLYYELRYIKSIEKDKAGVASTPEKTASEDSTFYFKTGLKYGAQAKFKEAEEECKKGLAINSSDYNLKEVLRIIDQLKSGKIREDFALYLFKGSNYLMNAQYKEAILEFKEALRLAPDDSELYYYLGICNYSLEQYQEAITFLQKAQELITVPDSEIFYYLGLCYFASGKYTQAINYLRKTLELDPNDAEAYSIIGTSNYLLGRYQQAKENLFKAKELFQKKGDLLQAKEIEDFLSRVD